ncbi:MAG TPA: hypothetical protein VKR30_10145 [Candidatus Limnocylindrales bacterium]|nr:hypothetical protein [Candidatus Limnocylindrales bacterium]
MAGLIRAFGRLILMAAVMGVVVVTSMYAGLAATVTVGLAIVLAGLVGMAGVVRRRRQVELPPVEHPTVVAMAPQSAVAAAASNDPEANMPRWRRPSVQAARFSDPAKFGSASRAPSRFGPATAPTTAELRVVRYAMVPLLDRPDEVLGMQMADLMAGDELQVVESSGPYWEVVTAEGERGWVHRTTLGMPATIGRETVAAEEPKIEVEDALSALLAARGLN